MLTAVLSAYPVHLANDEGGNLIAFSIAAVIVVVCGLIFVKELNSAANERKAAILRKREEGDAESRRQMLVADENRQAEIRRRVAFVRAALSAHTKGLVSVAQIAQDANLTVTETARILDLAMREESNAGAPAPTSIDHKTKCGVCGLAAELPVIVCTKCGATHHEICWAYNLEKCSRFGCT